MKTRINTNSLEAFKSLNLSKRQGEVYAAIKSTGEITSKGLSYALTIPINQITPRVNELLHKQLIRVIGVVQDKANGKSVSKYAIREAHEPLNVFEQSWESKYTELMEWLEHVHPSVHYQFELLINHKL